MPPKISIITPALNVEDFLASCIQNVIGQDCPEVEHIIIDGGSTDRTVDIIKEYAQRHPHIRWVSQKGLGQSAAMNRGIRMARGAIIGILNDDDYYEPFILKKILRIFPLLPQPAMLVGNLNVLDEKGQVKFVNRPSRLDLHVLLSGDMTLFPWNPSAYFYHRALHDWTGPYDTSRDMHMDIDFILKAVPAAHVTYVDEVWGNYRCLPGTKCYSLIQGQKRSDAETKLLESHQKKADAFPKDLPQKLRFYGSHPFAALRVTRLTITKFLLNFPLPVPLRTIGVWQKVIVITPTYDRPQRIKYLQRLIRVFSKIPDLTWIVVEDNAAPDKNVQQALAASGIDHVYLTAGPSKDKGNTQRNLGIDYVRENKLNGVVYFADDDNFFQPRLFSEISRTKRVAVLPVGKLGPHGIERPIIRHGRIVGWDAGWMERKFPVDMAGFAIHSKLFLNKPDTVWFYNIHGGETELLEMFIDSPQELELLCEQCQVCYAWHNQPLGEPLFMTKFKIILKNIWKAVGTRM